MTILPRHEQGGSFAAEGYARSTGKAGVCMATSGPGATNLVTAIADAYMDSCPLIAITGQVNQAMIGRGAFQETDKRSLRSKRWPKAVDCRRGLTSEFGPAISTKRFWSGTTG